MEIDEDFLNELNEDLEWEQNCLNVSIKTICVLK